jgi:hypothetical protein
MAMRVPVEQKSGLEVLSLAVVDPLLNVIAGVVGCSVNVFSVHCWTGAQVEIDVLDEGFGGSFDDVVLADAVCSLLASVFGCTALRHAPRVSEGATVGVSIGLFDHVLHVAVST